jgi:hypothetical protein
VGLIHSRKVFGTFSPVIIFMEYTENVKTEITKTFFNYIKSKNKKLYANLNDGLSENEINEITKSVDVKLPKEAVCFYELKNGFKDTSNLLIDQRLMFENGLFMSLEQSIEEYKHLRHESNMMGKLPIFDNGLGDFLLIDCDEKSETYKRILIWAPPLLIIEPIIVYDSLIKLLTTTTRCFIVKAYHYNKNNGLEVDFDEVCKVAKDANRNSQYWDIFIRPVGESGL